MTASATLAADPACMRPHYADGLFGWIHEKPGAGKVGVVLCGALAQEEVCTRYGLMLLADLLAEGGCPTLRFDYRGTGDSADIVLSLDTITADTRRAVDWLRAETGVESVVLCGLRLGATLALRAAADVPGVAGVALLAPIVSGAAYLRDMGVSVRFSPLALLDPVPSAGSVAPLNTNGFLWSAALRAELQHLDLSTLPPPGAPIYVAAPHASTRADAAVTAWRENGVAVTQTCFQDYPAFMRDPTTHVMPEASFAAVTAWISALPPLGVAAQRHLPVETTLALDDVEESPVRLGPHGATFGILCRPRHRAASPVSALMLHEGSSHHIGNGRAAVRLARRLAAAGHVSLRIDLSGMGDSPCTPGRRRPFSDPARIDEALWAVDALSQVAPGGVVASGLCSGAEMAFHAALADDRVVGTILVNIPAIGWEQVEPGAPPPPPQRTLRSSWRAIRAGGWRRVMRGEVRMVDAARGLRVRTRRALTAGHALVRTQMRHLAERGVATLFVFSDDDAGLPEVRAQLGDIADFAPARMQIFDRSDHHFNALDTRRRYEDLYVATIQQLSEAYAEGAAVTAQVAP